MIRRRPAPSPEDGGLIHLLARGCWRGLERVEPHDAMTLRRRIIHGDVEHIRGLWLAHRAAVEAATPRGARPWAERYVASGGRKVHPYPEWPAYTTLEVPMAACADHADAANNHERGDHDGDEDETT